MTAVAIRSGVGRITRLSRNSSGAVDALCPAHLAMRS